MKIKILLDPDDRLRSDLYALGICDDDNSDYVITKRSINVNYLSCKREEQSFFIAVKDIVFIESLGHDVYIHTADGVYTTRERLKQLEKILSPDDFLRVSSSAIIGLAHIRRIEASIFQKFILHMDSGDKVDVTRSYYYIFKDKLNI